MDRFFYQKNKNKNKMSDIRNVPTLIQSQHKFHITQLVEDLTHQPHQF